MIQNQHLSISGSHLSSVRAGSWRKVCGQAPGFITSSQSWSIYAIFALRSRRSRSRTVQILSGCYKKGLPQRNQSFGDTTSASRLSHNSCKGTPNTRQYYPIKVLRIVDIRLKSGGVA